MTNIEIRRKILEMAYERFKEHPYYRVTPKELKETLNITIKDLYFNTIYLEEKGLIELQKPLEGDLFVGVRITPRGLELVEDEYEFDMRFPVTKEKKSRASNIFALFNTLIDSIEVDDTISVDSKELVIEGVKDIQKELKNENPSYTRIKQLVSKLKQRNNEVSNKVTALLKNPLISKILLESAKQELENI